MPETTMTDQDAYALPEDTAFPGRLTSVKSKRNEFTWQAHHASVIDGRNKAGETGVISKWLWEFEVTDGKYNGQRAWGETEDRLTNHPDNKVRQWGETLRGKEFEIGEGLNTDDLLGLPCLFTVRHEEPRPKKDGTGFFYGCPVDDLFPSDSLAQDSYPAEPPF